MYKRETSLFMCHDIVTKNNKYIYKNIYQLI